MSHGLLWEDRRVAHFGCRPLCLFGRAGKRFGGSVRSCLLGGSPAGDGRGKGAVGGKRSIEGFQNPGG